MIRHIFVVVFEIFKAPFWNIFVSFEVAVADAQFCGAGIFFFFFFFFRFRTDLSVVSEVDFWPVGMGRFQSWKSTVQVPCAK